MRNLQLQVILDAVDRATGPLKKIAQGSAGAGQALKQTRDRIRELQEQQKRITAFTDMQSQAKASKNALSAKNAELKRLNTEIGASENPGKRLTRQQAAAQKQVELLTKRYQDQLHKSRELSSHLPKKAEDIRNLGHQQFELAKQIDAANKRLGQQQDALKRLGDADVTGKYRAMSAEVSSFARTTIVATTAAAGGIFAWAKSTATLGDDVAHAAERIGASNEVMQELRYAGQRGGGMDVSAVDSSLLTFTRRIGFAARGTGAAVQAYDELGLSAQALARMKPERALGIVADRLAEIEDHNDQLSYASQIFDTTGGANMLKVLKNGSAGLEEYRRQARLTGYILSDQAIKDSQSFNDALDDSLLGLKGMKNIIGAELMPAVTEVMQNFSSWLIENREQVEAFGKQFGDRLKGAVPIIIDIAKGVAQFVTTLAKATQWLATMLGGFDNLAIVMAVLFASKALLSIVAFTIAIWKFGAAIIAFSKTLSFAAGAMKLFSGGLALVSAALKTVTAFMMANPIVLIIMAIAGAAFLIYKYWDGIAGFFTGLWQRVSSIFEGLPEKFKAFGSAIIDGLIGGITGKLTALKEAVTGAGGKAVGWFKEKLGINSPSKVFAEFGVNTMEGYQKGLQRSESEPLGELTGFIKRIRQAGAGMLLGAASTLATAMPGSIGIDTAALGSVPIDTRAPLSASGSASGLTIEGGIHINVQAQAGLDEQALAHFIATEVQRALSAAGNRADAARRSAFHDID